MDDTQIFGAPDSAGAPPAAPSQRQKPSRRELRMQAEAPVEPAHLAHTAAEMSNDDDEAYPAAWGGAPASPPAPSEFNDDLFEPSAQPVAPLPPITPMATPTGPVPLTQPLANEVGGVPWGEPAAATELFPPAAPASAAELFPPDPTASATSAAAATPLAEVVPTGEANFTLRELLAAAQQLRASDVHISEHLPAQARVDGDLRLIPGYEAPLSHAWFRETIDDMLSKQQVEELDASGEIDLSSQIEGVSRIRVNVFRQLGSFAMALRFISEDAVPLPQLGLPKVVADLVMRPRGLVLVTGPTGSGKSTTLASMIDLVNNKLPAHIVTIEDPVEFRHTSKRSLIHQREIGSDTKSFAEAMRRVLRQDPDIILIGELRDPESISTALTAAETGHLVLGTLHTQSAAKSINRILDAFPPDQQAQVRTQLGDTLQGIITQTLLPKASGQGRIIATEVLVNTPAIANLIREGEVSQIYSMMQAGRSLGMHTLDQDLKTLYESGSISLEVAQSRAQDPKTISQVAGLHSEQWTQELDDEAPKGWEN